jgi:hypothetical protein
MTYKTFKTRDEMIEALCEKLNLTSRDIIYNTDGNKTTLVFKSTKQLHEFFDRLDMFKVAARSMTSDDFSGGFIIISSGKSACIE